MEIRAQGTSPSNQELIDNKLSLVGLLLRQENEGPSSEISLQLAAAYLQEADLMSAASATQAAAEQSGDPQIYLSLAGMYENLEFVDKALETYEVLASLMPGDPRIQEKVAEFRVLASDRAVRQRWLNSNAIILRHE